MILLMISKLCRVNGKRIGRRKSRPANEFDTGFDKKDISLFPILRNERKKKDWLTTSTALRALPKGAVV